MNILIDMNLTPRWVHYLRELGHLATHWSSLGKKSAPDQEICDFAREHGYVLVTNDLDFPRILAHTKGSKPSIVLLRGEPLTPEIRGIALVQALAACESELTHACILVLHSDPRLVRQAPRSNTASRLDENLFFISQTRNFFLRSPQPLTRPHPPHPPTHPLRWSQGALTLPERSYD